MRNIGLYANKMFSYLPVINRLPPISLIYDADDQDVTMIHEERQMFAFAGLCFVTFLALIQLVRHTCCVKVEYVRKLKTK